MQRVYTDFFHSMKYLRTNLSDLFPDMRSCFASPFFSFAALIQKYLSARKNSELIPNLSESNPYINIIIIYRDLKLTILEKYDKNCL